MVGASVGSQPLPDPRQNDPLESGSDQFAVIAVKDFEEVRDSLFAEALEELQGANGDVKELIASSHSTETKSGRVIPR